MQTVTILLAAAAVILLFLVLWQRHEIKSISRQLNEIKHQDTNELVHSIGSGSTFEELINEINFLLREMQRSRIGYHQKNHALEQMMTNISHDLRTPLTSAMGYIDLILHSELSEEEKKRELDIIQKRLVRLEELINSFFEFSRIVSRGKEPEKTAVNIVSVLEEAIVHYYDDYCARDRKIVFTCEQRILELLSNRSMLMRIFDNLIGNALKHGRGDLDITVEKAETIKIRFTNELEAPDVDIEHVFDEFYTTDISRTKGNTGLGLAIAKQFTEMLGGSICAELDGDRFTICITII